jgi:hypothetical protein
MNPKLLKSKTILGLIVAALPQIAQVATESGIIEIAAASDPQVNAVVTIAGLLFAAYGRSRAKGPIPLKTEKEFPKPLE